MAPFDAELIALEGPALDRGIERLFQRDPEAAGAWAQEERLRLQQAQFLAASGLYEWQSKAGGYLNTHQLFFERGARELRLGGQCALVLFGFDRLHDHQSRAIERLSTRPGGRSTIVATGTGSGKTESFLVPILDHCLREPGEGVKAIVLYPMNALANDQLKRLRRLLAGTERVSFARYTGDTPYSEVSALEERMPPRPPESPAAERYYRTEILASPPNLLLTNYTMLELLLTRREDRERLLQGAPLRYLVVDEVHTFQGVRGTEVACLIRRLKEHVGLGRGQLICVGTSATLQRGGDPRALVGFARDLFGEDLDPEAVVTEEPLPLPETGPVPPPAGPIPEKLLTADLTQPANLRALAEALLARTWTPSPTPSCRPPSTSGPGSTPSSSSWSVTWRSPGRWRAWSATSAACPAGRG